jgi:hypothetical protein
MAARADLDLASSAARDLPSFRPSGPNLQRSQTIRAGVFICITNEAVAEALLGHRKG